MPNHSLTIGDLKLDCQNGVYYVQVNTYDNGNAFGEYALLTSEAKHNATVKCITHT